MSMSGLSRLPLKYYVLGLLVLQNGGAVLLMRAVRALPGETEFVTQTAVIMQEVLKALTCMVVLLVKHGSLRPAFEHPSEVLKTSVPALLYLVQNNLQYIAVGCLEAPVYAVTYQSKVFWVAVCSVGLMNRTVRQHQWLALTILMAGVCAVQLNGQSSSSISNGSQTLDRRILGVTVLLIAALCSSLAAVSFEKLLKGSSADMWTRNLQLAFFSILCAAVPLLLSAEGLRVRRDGFFTGYTPLTWLCIAMNGWGGLLVGAVIKHADAILKDIAIGASIVVSATGSVVFFRSPVTWNLIVGILLVSWAVPLYAGRAHMMIPILRPAREKTEPPESPPKQTNGKPAANGVATNGAAANGARPKNSTGTPRNGTSHKSNGNADGITIAAAGWWWERKFFGGDITRRVPAAKNGCHFKG